VIHRRADPPQQGYIDERSVKLRCGPVNGSCPTGYWYVQTAFVRDNTDIAYSCSIGGYW
jgi:hypothetical protein